MDRPAIARRSCDHCRIRKIGCDRGSPCANCSAARLDCAYSAVPSKATSSKQRVLISAEYERKIDGIVKSIDSIKALLDERKSTPNTADESPDLVLNVERSHAVKGSVKHNSVSASSSEGLLDHSDHMVDFIRSIVKSANAANNDSKFNPILGPLTKLVESLEARPGQAQKLAFTNIEVDSDTKKCSMPPMEAVIDVLRWAKDHYTFNRIVWLSKVLSLDRFIEICQKVYFAVEEFGDIEFILANGFLSYVFSEHVVTSGSQRYRDYCLTCRKNLKLALLRLPLILPASMETIAALVFGTFAAIENSKATMAWSFISSALNLCQTLGYHRRQSVDDAVESLRDEKFNLFWTVYGLSNGLSLRLGRSVGIEDAIVTLPEDPKSHRTGIAKIQGQVYRELFSPAGLARPQVERAYEAELLAAQIRERLNETRSELLTTGLDQNVDCIDLTRPFYLQCDLVCSSSLLAMVLRAVPSVHGSMFEASDECVSVARDALNLHQECLKLVDSCTRDPFMVTTYLNWAIVHVPFVPFSILFTRAIQKLDRGDLARLDRFTASLQAGTVVEHSTLPPHRLYELVCQTAHIYIDSKIPPIAPNVSFVESGSETIQEAGFADCANEQEVVLTDPLQPDFAQDAALSDWFYKNQRFMGLLDDEYLL